MRWPWISRRLEMVRENEQLRAERDELRAQIDERKHYADLLEKYHSLRLSGANAPEVHQPLPKKEHDPVIAAINEKAGNDRKLRAIMGKEAMKARRLGLSDNEIIEQIERGHTDEEGLPV